MKYLGIAVLLLSGCGAAICAGADGFTETGLCVFSHGYDVNYDCMDRVVVGLDEYGADEGIWPARTLRDKIQREPVAVHFTIEPYNYCAISQPGIGGCIIPDWYSGYTIVVRTNRPHNESATLTHELKHLGLFATIGSGTHDHRLFDWLSVSANCEVVND